MNEFESIQIQKQNFITNGIDRIKKIKIKPAAKQKQKNKIRVINFCALFFLDHQFWIEKNRKWNDLSLSLNTRKFCMFWIRQTKNCTFFFHCINYVSIEHLLPISISSSPPLESTTTTNNFLIIRYSNLFLFRFLLLFVGLFVQSIMCHHTKTNCDVIDLKTITRHSSSINIEKIISRIAIKCFIIIIIISLWNSRIRMSSHTFSSCFVFDDDYDQLVDIMW